MSGNRTLASLYDLIMAENLQTEGRAKQFKGIGEWNQGRTVSHNGHVEHWLNNEKVVEFDRFSQTFDLTFDLSVHDMFVCWERGACLCSVPQNAVVARTSWPRASRPRTSTS